MNKKILTVLQVNKYIKGLLEEDVILSDILVEGEISNFKHHSSGHMYFTLKDAHSSINCVMFKDRGAKLPFVLENGMKVLSYGRVSLYEKTGNYQIYIDNIEPSGLGALYMAFNQLKEKLDQKGYFEQAYKKPLPTYPQKVAIITSPTGAAISDIIRISKRRNKNIELIIVPALVQGENAPSSIAKSIQLADRYSEADIIIVGRGGGSIEDLWAFNEEIVADAVFNCKTPIISAVGHETDFTICDFVADYRASTPSAAAEIAIPNLSSLVENVYQLTNSLNYFVMAHMESKREMFERVLKSNIFKKPSDKVFERQLYLEKCLKEIEKELLDKIEISKIRLKNNLSVLNSLSPLQVLARGYAIAYSEDGNCVGSVGNLNINDDIHFKFNDGKIKAKVLYKVKEDFNG